MSLWLPHEIEESEIQQLRRERDEARERLAKAEEQIEDLQALEKKNPKADDFMRAYLGRQMFNHLWGPELEALGAAVDAALNAKEAAEAQVARLRETLQTISDYASWQTDDDADPEDQNPEDMVAHINGLIRRACQEVLK